MMNVSSDFFFNTSKPIPVTDGDAIYYRMEWFLAAFYMVRPSRTMVQTVAEVPKFFTMVLRHSPFFFAMEMFLLWLVRKPSYRWSDSLVGFSAMMTSAIPLAFIEAGMVAVYTRLYDTIHIVDLPYDSMWTWLLAVLVVDLAMYATHRSTHEFGLLWASHQLHHTTENYTFTSAVRFTFLDKFCLTLFLMPLSLFIPPAQVVAHHQLNLIYQIWIHTRVLRSFGILDYILVCPIGHEIHHGSNRFCIDKNYGAVFSIWDIIFGTQVFAKDHKGANIHLGLVHPLKSHDVAYIFGWIWRDMYQRMASYDKVSDKVAVLYKGPGWSPGKPRLGDYKEIPETPDDKYHFDEKKSSYFIYWSCAAHLLIVLLVSTTVMWHHYTLPYWEQLYAHAFIVWTAFNVGYILEHKWWAPYSEMLRCLAYFVVEFMLSGLFGVALGTWLTHARVFMALSAIAWVFNRNYYTRMAQQQQKVD